MVKNRRDFASIYLLASIMYCNTLGKQLPVFAKITYIAFSGLRHDFLSACIISDDRRGAL